MTCLYLCDENYVDDDISIIDESSENASYPASNTFNEKRRGKVWRTQGYYNVTSSNNKLVFRDDTTTDKTATIAVAEYTSVTSFLAAVDTALEAAGAANYTVVQDTTTLKVKITSDLSGGATAFQLRTADANFTSAALLGFDTASHKTGAATYTADTLVIHQYEFLKVDLTTAGPVNTVILIGKRNEPIKLSPTATIKIQANSTDVWTSPEFEQTLSYHEDAIFAVNSSDLGSYRYWRLYFEDKDNVNGYLEIANIFIGNSFIPSRGAPQFGFQNSLEDLSVTVLSESGVALSDLKPKRQKLIFDFDFMTKQDAEALEDIFEIYGTSKPFFVVMDPNEYFTTENERMVKYVKFESEPTITLDSPNNFSARIQLREEL